MLIELIDSREVEWKCRCSGNVFATDVIGRLCETIDNIYFSHISKVSESLQFPYTEAEWAKGDIDKYKCEKCGRIRYRVIRTKEIS